MATQDQINDAKDTADDLWNIYQTVEDMEQKMRNCDDMADFKANISMDSFEAISSELKRVSNSFNKNDFHSSDMITFDDLDGRKRELGLGVMGGSLKPLSDRFEDYLNYLHHDLNLSDTLVKDLLKGLVDFRRGALFVMFAAFETVSKMKPDDDLDVSDTSKSVKKINPEDVEEAEVPETLSSADEGKMRSLAIEIPELVEVWYKAATELDSDPSDDKLLEDFNEAADELGQRLLDLEDLTHDIDKKIIPNTRQRHIQQEFEDFFDIQDSIRKYANYYNNGDLNNPYLEAIDQKVIYKVLKNNTRTNIEELIGALQPLEGLDVKAIVSGDFESGDIVRATTNIRTPKNTMEEGEYGIILEIRDTYAIIQFGDSVDNKVVTVGNDFLNRSFDFINSSHASSPEKYWMDNWQQFK